MDYNTLTRILLLLWRSCTLFHVVIDTQTDRQTDIAHSMTVMPHLLQDYVVVTYYRTMLYPLSTTEQTRTSDVNMFMYDVMNDVTKNI